MPALIRVDIVRVIGGYAGVIKFPDRPGETLTALCKTEGAARMQAGKMIAKWKRL